MKLKSCGEFSQKKNSETVDCLLSWRQNLFSGLNDGDLLRTFQFPPLFVCMRFFTAVCVCVCILFTNVHLMPSLNVCLCMCVWSTSSLAVARVRCTIHYKCFVLLLLVVVIFLKQHRVVVRSFCVSNTSSCCHLTDCFDVLPVMFVCEQSARISGHHTSSGRENGEDKSTHVFRQQILTQTIQTCKHNLTSDRKYRPAILHFQLQWL